MWAHCRWAIWADARGSRSNINIILYIWPHNHLVHLCVLIFIQKTNLAQSTHTHTVRFHFSCGSWIYYMADTLLWLYKLRLYGYNATANECAQTNKTTKRTNGMHRAQDMYTQKRVAAIQTNDARVATPYKFAYVARKFAARTPIGKDQRTTVSRVFFCGLYFYFIRIYFWLFSRDVYDGVNCAVSESATSRIARARARGK